MNIRQVSIYIHWPYCSNICTYCAFNKYRIPENGIDHSRMLNSLTINLKYWIERYKTTHDSISIMSVYFGGGTPSLMDPKTVRSILDTINKMNKIDSNAEVTLEYNPNNISLQSLLDFKDAGITRVSIGVQSLDDKILKFMGRDHSSARAINAIKDALKVYDSERVSIDMIYGMKNQDLSEWEKDLEMICKIGADHLSLYQLTLERGTKLFTRGITLPNEDVLYEFWEKTLNVTRRNNFNQYEVSSFTRGYQSMQNTSYWNGVDYIGIGPGAHGRIMLKNPDKKIRTYEILDPKGWMQQSESKGHGNKRIVEMTEKEGLEEMMLLGLRTAKGIDGEMFYLATGRRLDVVIDQVDGTHLEWTDEGAHGRGIRATNLAIVDYLTLKLVEGAKL